MDPSRDWSKANIPWTWARAGSRKTSSSPNCYPHRLTLEALSTRGGTAARMAISMEGRTAVVFGVANKRSIAWAIAQQMQQAGARLAITYQNERLKQEADELIAGLPNAQDFQCDVSSDDEIARLFEQLKEKYGKIDTLVHSIAY